VDSLLHSTCIFRWNNNNNNTMASTIKSFCSNGPCTAKCVVSSGLHVVHRQKRQMGTACYRRASKKERYSNWKQALLYCWHHYCYSVLMPWYWQWLLPCMPCYSATGPLGHGVVVIVAHCNSSSSSRCFYSSSCSACHCLVRWKWRQQQLWTL
jgi:hypothetical protein